MDAAMMSRLLEPRTLVLPVPYSTSGQSSATSANTIDGVEALAEAQRREACARAAAVRAGEADDSSDDDLGSDDADDDNVVAHDDGGGIWEAELASGSKDV